MSPSACCRSTARAANSFAKAAELTCYFPDRREVLVERRAPDGPLLGALPAIDEANSLVYEIRGGERERLLGRTTRVVALHPRDEYRYGYRLWIDEQTSMPLKTQLCNQSGEVIEQIVFSTIDLPERIPDSMFKPQMDASNYRWFRADRQVASNATPGVVGSHATAARFPHGHAFGPVDAGLQRAGRAPRVHRRHRLGVGIRRAAQARHASLPKVRRASVRRRRSRRWSMATRSPPSVKCRPNTVELIAKQVKASKAAAAPSSATEGLGLAPRRK